MKNKILIIDPLSKECLFLLRKFDLHYIPNATLEEVKRELENTKILILRSQHTLTEETFASAKSLKAVIRAGSGYDNIPLPYLKKREIFFQNIPHASTRSVAEFSIGLMLSGLRNLIEANRDIKKGNWNKEKFIGHEIYGKTLGLVGFGNIGKEIYSIAKHLGFKKILYTTEKSVYDDPVLEKCNLNTIFAKSDIISVQVPLNSTTAKLIDDKHLSIMKKHVILINISRYGVFNMEQIITYLKLDPINNQFLKIFIDPVEKNNMSQCSTFSDLPIFLFPHIAGSTFETQIRLGEKIKTLVENLSNE